MAYPKLLNSFSNQDKHEANKTLYLREMSCQTVPYLFVNQKNSLRWYKIIKSVRLHDPKKVRWNRRLTFIDSPIIKHLILSPDCGCTEKIWQAKEIMGWSAWEWQKEARYGFCWPSKSFWVERTPSRKTCQKAQPSVEENKALKWIWWWWWWQFVKILSPTCWWKMSITLNRLEYFNKILHTHWNWQDVAQEIVNCYLGLAEALPRFRFWKSENSPISWTEWNILINFCLNIDIDKV